MYANFFGLSREPFSLAPDPRYLFMSERHREALAHLLYGLNGGGGFVLLSGEIGAGKTTVCRCFLEQIPKRCNVAYIFNPKLTVTELLRSVCEEFRIPVDQLGPEASIKDYVDPLNEFLLKTHAVGQNNVLIIDEAQNLSADVLEQLRLLTNLETNERKLLQIILIGQPELRDMIARPELEQLAQRVVARFHLEALTPAETSRYIRHRMSVAGLSRPLPFDAKARQRIHQLSRGVPRRINLLCDRALLGAYASGKAKVDRATVDKAAAEVFDRRTIAGLLRAGATRSTAAWAAGIAGVALCGWGAWAVYSHLSDARKADTVASAEASASAPAGAASAAPAAASAASAAASAPAPVASAAPPAVTESATLPTLLSEGDAWRQLSTAWGVTLPAGDACVLASRSGLQCFRSNSGLSLVRLLSRPGVVALQGTDGKTGHALLVGLTPTGVRLRVGNTVHTMPMDTMSKRWRGEFATFYKVPPGYSGRISDGAGGPAVEWIATRLTALQGGTPPRDGQTLDAGLKAKVQAFQMAQGLRPDGLVRPTMLMQLNRASGVDEPRLQIGAAN